MLRRKRGADHGVESVMNRVESVMYKKPKLVTWNIGLLKRHYIDMIQATPMGLHIVGHEYGRQGSLDIVSVLVMSYIWPKINSDHKRDGCIGTKTSGKYKGATCNAPVYLSPDNLYHFGTLYCSDHNPRWAICRGTLKNGKPCTSRLGRTYYDETRPCTNYCGRHKSQTPPLTQQQKEVLREDRELAEISMWWGD